MKWTDEYVPVKRSHLLWIATWLFLDACFAGWRVMEGL